MAYEVLHAFRDAETGTFFNKENAASLGTMSPTAFQAAVDKGLIRATGYTRRALVGSSLEWRPREDRGLPRVYPPDFQLRMEMDYGSMRLWRGSPSKPFQVQYREVLNGDPAMGGGAGATNGWATKTDGHATYPPQAIRYHDAFNLPTSSLFRPLTPGGTFTQPPEWHAIIAIPEPQYKPKRVHIVAAIKAETSASVGKQVRFWVARDIAGWRSQKLVEQVVTLSMDWQWVTPTTPQGSIPDADTNVHVGFDISQSPAARPLGFYVFGVPVIAGPAKRPDEIGTFLPIDDRYGVYMGTAAENGLTGMPALEGLGGALQTFETTRTFPPESNVQVQEVILSPGGGSEIYDVHLANRDIVPTYARYIRADLYIWPVAGYELPGDADLRLVVSNVTAEGFFVRDTDVEPDALGGVIYRARVKVDIGANAGATIVDWTLRIYNDAVQVRRFQVAGPIPYMEGWPEPRDKAAIPMPFPLPQDGALPREITAGTRINSLEVDRYITRDKGFAHFRFRWPFDPYEFFNLLGAATEFHLKLMDTGPTASFLHMLQAEFQFLDGVAPNLNWGFRNEPLDDETIIIKPITALLQLPKHTEIDWGIGWELRNITRILWGVGAGPTALGGNGTGGFTLTNKPVEPGGSATWDLRYYGTVPSFSQLVIGADRDSTLALHGYIDAVGMCRDYLPTDVEILDYQRSLGPRRVGAISV